jgi:glyoxylase-like metal-dependent hydrolase (beta-lactamase superfamily II)
MAIRGAPRRALVCARVSCVLHASSLLAGALPTRPPEASPQQRGAPTRVDVAEGVYLFQSAPWAVGNEGNSVVIVGDDGALVFDTNGTPLAAEAVLAEIRALTDRPVRWIVNSHWHWDHWYGTEVYRRAFPDVQVIAQKRGAAMMAGPAVEWNRPGMEEQLPAFLASVEERVAEGEAAAEPPEDLPHLKALVAEGRLFLEQKRRADLVLPDVTFTGRLDLDLGGRTVQVLNYGRAVTPGDAFLWLPEEEILVTGDLLVDPVTFALSVYPTEWLETMEGLDRLDASILVPGQGAPMHDEDHLHATMDAMRVLLELGPEAKGRGLDPDRARAEIVPELHDMRVRITSDDPQVNQAFEHQFVDWFLHRVWDELDGRLSDTIISAIPAR